MEGLINAAADFLAAILSGLGFVGRPRRRAGIEHNLVLLEKLRASPDFGPDSKAHKYLQDHITADVAKFTGVESKKKKPIPWSSVFFALLIGIPAAYWTYKLDEDGFRLLSLLPGTVAALMLIAALGMLFAREEDVTPESE